MALKTSNKNRTKPTPILTVVPPVLSPITSDPIVTEPPRDNKVHIPRPVTDSGLTTDQFKFVAAVVALGLVILIIL